jgi:signal transduction histidine kinase
MFTCLGSGALRNWRSPTTGAGLGLWITRRLVEGMGGVIRVASTREVGSTFTVELPLAGQIPA